MTFTPAGIGAALLAALCSIAVGLSSSASAQEAGPTMVDSRLGVRVVTSGLVTPTSIAFLGPNDFLVLEKNTVQVKRVVNGAVQSTVLDLAVNFSSERGLLGIALHPNFATNPSVYLYWTESTTGSDTNVLSETPLLGNRVDRFGSPEGTTDSHRSAPPIPQPEDTAARRTRAARPARTRPAAPSPPPAGQRASVAAARAAV